VESAWKLARQYFKLIGEPTRYKVISRYVAYHGTTMGALSITGIPEVRAPFEPLVPGRDQGRQHELLPGARARRRPGGVRPVGGGRDRAGDRVRGRGHGRRGLPGAGAERGGCFPPPPGYFQRVREICDRHGVLLVSDEVICAFGRLGHLFGADRYGYQPDMITCAKGMTSGYSPIGALLVSDRIAEPFLHGATSFPHGFTFAGHPVSAAVALANLDILEREDLPGHVRANEGAFRATLSKLLDLPIVGEVRGDGYFYGIELVKDKATKETFDDEESERLLRGFLSRALFEAGLYCRADDRGDPVVQLAPPLICEQSHFDEIEQILRSVLTEAWSRI
jgi:adenosylmethionine-8-amino-7-oxononanoate aminotransferase